MPEPFSETCIVRFLLPDGAVVGLGALVGARRVVTCAHVVNAALGKPRNSQDKPGPDDRVHLDFPFVPEARGTVFTAGVSVWRPPPRSGAIGEDIAGVVIDDDPPSGAVPGSIAVDMPQPGTRVRVFGYPAGRPEGGWVEPTVRGRIPEGWMQLDSGPDSALRVQPRYSGSPVIDASISRIVGLVGAAEGEPAPGGRAAWTDSYAIGPGQFRDLWPDEPEIPARDVAGTTTPVTPGSRTQLTVLHLPRLRFRGGDQPRLDPDELFKSLYRDIVEHGDATGASPDLLVVTGDLADRGLPDEYRQAVGFLSRLAGALGIPRRHVAVVPGPHDVNRLACQSYFLGREAEQQEPVPPYFPKWAAYRAAFEEFYAGADDAAFVPPSFTPDEPWTLFEMPAFNLVIAGLNSTIPESHRDQARHGELGPGQVEWFARQLANFKRKGWLRLAAVHCPPDQLTDADTVKKTLLDPGLVNLALASGSASDDGPDWYETITIDRSHRSREVRLRTDGQWRPAGSGQAGPRPHQFSDVGAVFPAREPRPPKRDPEPVIVPVTPPVTGYRWFLEQVESATRSRFSDASVEARPEGGYLRISRSPVSGIAELSIVGVCFGDVTENAVDRFAHGVHAQFASVNHALQSELVYSGAPAPTELIMRARRHGIQLRSFVEYQGLIDLRPLISAQRKELDDDGICPSELYIDQRFRVVTDRQPDVVTTGLIRQATEWLAEDTARLIVVLGDFGRGKTSFLHQLTRILQSELGDVTPVLVELRNLLKGATLDALLAQHLAARHVDGVSNEKLRYMIASGRIALLFDGYDELELRVGYDTADVYLRSLLKSVSGQAKVILTSRTQHFRSTEQVSTAIGKRVASQSGNRVVILEDFTEEQIQSFLVRLYGGDTARARRRYDLIAGIEGLLELTQNPRMLAFVAQLEESRLEEVRAGGDRLNPARLYEEIIGHWLGNEEQRQRRMEFVALTTDERFRACTSLALRLWKSPASSISLEGLTEEIRDTLTELAERDFSDEHAAHAIGSGSLLIRSGDDAFRFVHRSVMEWFVANHAARTLRDENSDQVLRQKQMSRLMADFFIDLVGPDRAGTWAARTARDAEAGEDAKQNALAVLEALRGRRSAPCGGTGPCDDAGPSARQDLTRADLRDQDLRDQDLNGTDLRGANLRGANLRGMRLDDTDLSGADLTGANLREVVMTRGSLAGTILTGSDWTHAAVLGTAGTEELRDAPELAAAALSGRDAPSLMLQSTGPCADAVFSPDSHLLAIARGSTVELADASSGVLLRVIRGHAGRVTAVAFSPDGTLLATASGDETARIWDTATGTPRARLSHDSRVTAVAFSPDGLLLATATWNHHVSIWAAGTGDRRFSFPAHNDPITSIAFSPDGTRLATASYDSSARLFQAADGTYITSLSGHTDAVRAVAFSPDGALVATASRDSTVRIWDSVGHRRTTLTGHGIGTRAVAFSPDGAQIATASSDRTARIWDTGTGRERARLTGHADAVLSVAFSPDGALIATASSDRTTRIWNADGTPSITITAHKEPVTSVAFSPDGAFLATASDNRAARLWHAGAGVCRGRLTEDTDTVRALAFSPGSGLLAAISFEGEVQTWDTASGEHRTAFTVDDGSVRGIAFAADGATVTGVRHQGGTVTWDTETGVRADPLPGPGGMADVVAFSPDGTLVATAASDESVSLDKNAQVWDLATGTLRASLTGHRKTVHAIAFAPDNSLIATASEDTVRIWRLPDAPEAAPARRLRGRSWLRASQAAAAESVAPDPGQTLKHSSAVADVQFSPDGRLLAVACEDGTVTVRDAADFGEGKVLAGHDGAVRAVAFAPDGNLIATGSDDGTVRLWHPAGEYLATLVPLPDDGYAVLLPDGSYKLEGDAGDAFWWAMKLCRFAPGELDEYPQGIRRLGGDDPILPPDGPGSGGTR